jgi:hypothetical protein
MAPEGPDEVTTTVGAIGSIDIVTGTVSPTSAGSTAIGVGWTGTAGTVTMGVAGFTCD